jgi:hypothetical protein
MRICPRCQHVNPAQAAYCWYDGLDLRAAGAESLGTAAMTGVVQAGPVRLPHEFVFPAGRHCLTYDDLAAGCLEEWETAAELLTSGAFRFYFTGAGRLDLARAADEAVKQHPDPEVALDAFLGRLPASRLPNPELELTPRKLLLGAMHVGEGRQVTLVVQNVGTGLLHGTLRVVEGGPWLRLADQPDGASLTLKLRREQQAVFQVDTRNLPAPMACAARLTVITNGGIVEVPVRLDVTPRPFTEAPYAGATSPRDLAVAMRSNPKPAVALLEKGSVIRWFEANSWAYPVVGPTAPGMAAVQQFFEGLGLARPPRLLLTPAELHLAALPGARLRERVELSSQDRKWIYAHATSEIPWLEVTTPAVSGPQRAVLELALDSGKIPPGGPHETTLRIVANGGQSLALPVRVEVQAPVGEVRPRPVEARPMDLPRPVPITPESEIADSGEGGPGRRRWLQPLLVGALTALAARLLVALPADVYARPLAAAADAGLTAAARWSEAPAGVEFLRHFVVATWWLGGLLGAGLVVRRGRWSALPFGLLAGAAGGAAGSATLASVLPLADALPRLVWAQVAAAVSGAGLGPAPILLMWLLVAAGCWAVQGAVLGALLGVLGEAGRRVLAPPSSLLAWSLARLGLKRAAALVTVG